MNLNKALIWAIIVVVIVIAGAYGWHWYANRTLAYQFDGTIEKVASDHILVKGHYYADGHAELQNENQERTVKVMIGTDTQIIKTSIYLPTIKEVQAMGGSYKMEDLKRDTAPGTIQEASGVITISTKANIYRKEAFLAEKIEYFVRIYPRE